MKYLKISQCKRELNFSPFKPEAPILPAYSFGDYLISGFTKSDEDFAVSLSGEFIDVWTTIYPKLTIPELARFVEGLKKIESLYTEELLTKLLQKYYVKKSDETIETLVLITKLPMTSQNYLSEKDVSLSELNLLRYFRTEQLWQSLLTALNKFEALSLSKSQLDQALELYCELLLLNTEIKLDAFDNGEDLIKSLKFTRYPRALSQDESRQNKIKSFSWPLRTNARWIRHGDQAGLELKLTSFTPQELDRQIETLTHIKAEIKSGLWNLN